MTVDLTRVDGSGTIMDATGNGTLDEFIGQSPATAADLLTAADWCANYGGAHDDDANVAQLARAIGHLMREVRKRERAAVEREVRRRIAEKTGLKATDPRVVKAAHKLLKEEVK